MILNSNGNTLVKSLRRCSAKSATKTSMKDTEWSIKRYPISPLSALVNAFFCVQAFVLHGSHSSVTIYYCKFPNQYLSEISRFGKKFLTHPERTFHGKVKLLRTNKYSLRNTRDRVAIFKLIANLLWYLVSGKSRVGFLYDYPENPLHDIVFPLHLQD